MTDILVADDYPPKKPKLTLAALEARVAKLESGKEATAAPTTPHPHVVFRPPTATEITKRAKEKAKLRASLHKSLGKHVLAGHLTVDEARSVLKTVHPDAD